MGPLNVLCHQFDFVGCLEEVQASQDMRILATTAALSYLTVLPCHCPPHNAIASIMGGISLAVM